MARQAFIDERGSVHGVNPGTELGRYTVGTRIETIPGGERWTARDTTLERDVTLLLMPAEELTTAAALDAARRAAGVEAAQLVRILDVGTEGPLSFIAEEGVASADTYAELIGSEGLPAEEVRRITGEVATGIEAARARGLHHLTLVPETVLLTQDGRVKVRGLATAAALAGVETEGEEADREDATGVVGLTYAGLTATWPLESASTLPPAPDEGDGPPPPSRVAVGVPGDLDTICRETLSQGTGPDSPGDYAAQIAPWSRIPLAGAVRASPTPEEQSTRSADDEGGSGAPVAAAAGAAGATAAAGAATGASEDEKAGTGRTGPREEDQPTSVMDARSGADESAPGETSDARTGRRASAGAAAGAAAAAAGGARTGGRAIGERLGRAAKSAGGRSREAIHDARARREAIREDRARRSSLGSAPVSAELESPAPFLPPEAGTAPSRKQANLVLLLMSAFVALACVAGIFGTAQIGEKTDLGKILGGDETTAVETSDQSSSPAGEGGEPFAILNAAGFDPAPGDGVEHNAEVQRVYDGDPETAWTTEGYTDESFGGVKEGVGITVDLGQAQQISSVTLALPTSAEATVYAGDEATNSGTEIGSTEGRDGEVALEPSSEVEAQYVTVWFTSLAQAEDGRYRAALGEITIR